MNNADKKAPEIKSLPLGQWPLADRAAWQEVCRPALRLVAGGKASHMRPVTQNDLARRYGLFLNFLARSAKLDPQMAAGAQVTPENVQRYVYELEDRVSSVTVYGCVQKLRRITQLIAPRRDLAWLIDLERDLFSTMRPKSKWDRVVLVELVVEAGLTLITEGETAPKLPKLTRARLVRNGLMLVLLALYPIRLKNFAALAIGRSIVKIDGVWWIVLTAAETKGKRPDEREIEDYVGEAIDKYIETYRPILGRGKEPGSALWLAMTGDPMSECYVREVITETTLSTLGVPINPHMFRTNAATTAAIHAGDQPHLGSALLQHTHGTVTLENYNRATGITASRAYASVVRRYRNDGQASRKAT